MLPLLSKDTLQVRDVRARTRRRASGARTRDVVKTTLGKAVNGTLTLTTRSRRTIVLRGDPAGGRGPRDRRGGRARRGLEAIGRIQGMSRRRRPGSATRSPRPKEKQRRRASCWSVSIARRSSSPRSTSEEMLAKISGLQNESAKLKDTVAKLAVIVGDITKAKSRQTQLEERAREDHGGPGAHPRQPPGGGPGLRPRPPLSRYAEIAGGSAG